MTYKYIALCLLYIAHHGLLSHDIRLHAPQGNTAQPNALSAEKKQLPDAQEILRSLVKSEDWYTQLKQAMLEEHVAYNNTVDSWGFRGGFFLGGCTTIACVCVAAAQRRSGGPVWGIIPVWACLTIFYGKFLPSFIKKRLKYNDTEELYADVERRKHTLEQIQLVLKLLEPITDRGTHGN